MDFTKCHLEIFERNNLKDYQYELYDQCFELWQQIWKDTYKSVDCPYQVFSDNYTRQDEMIALYKDETPIALIFHRFIDLKTKTPLYDSFFQIWPEDIKFNLPKNGSKMVIGNQITVHPDYRKSESGLPTKFLISYLSLKHLSRLKDYFTIAMTRNDKGIDKVFYKSGAKKLGTTSFYEIPEVDMILFDHRENPIEIPMEFQLSVESIYKKWLKNNNINIKKAA